MSIDFTDVPEATNEGASNGLSFGVHDTTMTGTLFGESAKGTPFVEITFVNEGGEHLERFYTTKNALPRLKYLLIKAGIEKEALDKEIEEKQLEAMITGKKVRIRVGGREFKGKDGNVKIAKELSFAGFAEPISVPKNESKLIYDESVHVKRLAPTEKEYDSLDLDAKDDDLPF